MSDFENNETENVEFEDVEVVEDELDEEIDDEFEDEAEDDELESDEDSEDESEDAEENAAEQDPDFLLFDKTNKAARLLRCRRGALQRELEEKSGKTSSLVRALKLLQLKPKMEQKEMADLLGMRLRELDAMLAEAEKKDIVARVEPEEPDMRKVIVMADEDAVERAEAEENKGEALVPGLSDEERDQFLALLDKVIDPLVALGLDEERNDRGNFGGRGGDRGGRGGFGGRGGDRGGFRGGDRGGRGGDRGGRGGFGGRDSRGGDRGGFRNDRGGDRGGFRGGDRNDRGGFRSDRGGDRGGFRNDRGGDRGGFRGNNDRGFGGRDNRGGDRGGFRGNNDRGGFRNDRGGNGGGFRGGDRGGFRGGNRY